MKIKGVVVICIIIFILVSIFIPTTEAKIFDIGNKISESDPTTAGSKIYSFDSGCILPGKNNTLDFAYKIFDGNTSTGINNFIKKGFYMITFSLNFPTPINVTNITVKPNFVGNASNYNLQIILNHYCNVIFAWDSDEEKTYNINCTIEEIRFDIYEKVIETKQGNTTIINKTGYIYFNDIIIDYEPLTHTSDNLQTQIYKLYQDINSIKNEISIINMDIMNIRNNITDIKNNLPSEYNDSALQDQINNLTQELNSLKENLTRINNSIPMAYNDSALKSNIFSLESENIFLKQQIGNLTIRINNLTTELEKLSSEVQNLQGVGGEKTNDRDQEYRIYEYTYPIIFGIIIIILLLIILKLSLTILKRKPHDMGESRSDDILLSKIKYDILTNKEIKDSRLYDDEYKKLLENGYRKGEMSQETYNYIKTVLEVSENPQNLKK